MSVIKRILELNNNCTDMRTTYYYAHDEYRGFPMNYRGYSIGWLIDMYPFEIEKLKTEGRFYLSKELLHSLKQAVEIAKKPKQKNKNQMELF